MLTLQTERLILRDFTETDFDAFYATTDDPAYRRYYPEWEMTRAAWQDIFTQILAATAAAERTTYQLAICLPDDTLIGTCGVRIEAPQHRQASFGCAIARPYWGQGYAGEASRCLLTFAFTSLPIHRIYAETNSANGKARALADYLGMRLEGELRQHKFFRDRWWDTAVYAVLQEEWTERWSNPLPG